MFNSKKVLSSITALVLIVSILCSCGSNGKTASTGTAANKPNKAATEKQKIETKNFADAYEGDYVSLGKYFINNSETTEPLIWQVVKRDEDNHNIMVMTKDAIDCVKFNNELAHIVWMNSSIRKWLNNEFFNTAFTDEDKSKMFKGYQENKKNPSFETTESSETSDYVFLLSLDEVNNNLTEEMKKCYGTKYFIEKGGYVNTAAGFEGLCDWWLRTPGDNDSHVTNVSNTGDVVLAGDFVNTDDFGVRPAIIIHDEGIVKVEEVEEVVEEVEHIDVDDISEDKIRDLLVKIDGNNNTVGDAVFVSKEDYLAYKDMKVALVGDSIADCSKGALVRYFNDPKIDSRSGREMNLGLEVTNHLKDINWIQPADVFIFSLGSNAKNGIEMQVLEDVYKAIDGKPMIMLTVSIPYAGQMRNRNREIKKFIDSHENCYLADWATTMDNHPELFTGDRIHPTNAGGYVYAQLLFKRCVDILKEKNK